MEAINRIRKIVLVILFMLAIAGCREKDKSPKMADTLLYGHFYDGALYDDLRLFAMRLHANGTFTWYDANNIMPGEWSQVENKMEFKFTTGALNRWTGTINGNEITDMIGPTPTNFHFTYINIAKSNAPAKIKDTEWREVNQSRILLVTAGQPDGRYQIVHPHFRSAGSNGLIYDQVDKQVLITSKTLNNGIYVGMILLNGDNMVVYRYEAAPLAGEKKYGTYTYVAK